MTHHTASIAAACLGLWALSAVPATGSPAITRVLGVSHHVVSSGPPLVVDLTIRPARGFDRVAVEGASGVKTLTGDCQFSGVAAGTPYTCRLEVTGSTSDAFMSVNIVGTSEPSGGGLAQSDVQHLTFRNAGFQKTKPTASVHQLPRTTSQP